VRRTTSKISTFRNSLTGRHFPSELNAIHAVREGNGRSQLTYFALLAQNAGHPLQLDRLDPDEMLAR
jgi:cell filamentation protein